MAMVIPARSAKALQVDAKTGRGAKRRTGYADCSEYDRRGRFDNPSHEMDVGAAVQLRSERSVSGDGFFAMSWVWCVDV